MQGRGKEIVLLALAVGALGLALYTFRGKPEPASAPEPPPAPREAAEQQVAETPGEEAASEEGAEGETAGGIRNPFSAPDSGGTVEAGEAEGTDLGAAEPPPGEQPPTATGFKLEGIMTGPPPFAVIRHGDRPYFAKVGDEIADGYRVDVIRGEREVVLTGQHGTIVLRTGKSS